MSRGSSEYKKLKERRTIASTIGYCFVIVLVLLLVMSSILTETYTSVLKSERADAMESIAVSSSAALGHTNIEEGMKYPLPIYSYAKGKSYIFDIYTKAGNSFLRLCTTSNVAQTDQYYLSGVGNEYNNCFEIQESALTTRTDDDVEYVCAIAPIISSENTVAGILEVRMPMSDFNSTVNGMSLSWVFTIFAIAVSMGIIIFELNLFVTALSEGNSNEAPILVLFGENAIRFLSFFMALGAVMPPLFIAGFVKDTVGIDKPILLYSLIMLGLVLYTWGFFGFSALRKMIKFKLTGNIAMLVGVVLGYLFSLIAGISDNLIVLLIFILPIAFCFGMPIDALRDYRINAAKLNYKGFDDRNIHNIQSTSYFLGASVGAVIAGICYERFGLMIVSIICGAVLFLSALGISYFMKNNTPVKEGYMPVNRWLELIGNKYTGRFLMSSFFILGLSLAFLLGFTPAFLETVGISLPTTAFYYMIAAFSACFVTAIIKSKLAYMLTSKVRVIIASFSFVIALLLFALSPTAKILCISCFLIGISLGIHDFYYLYVFYIISKDKFRVNIRRGAELTLIFGLISGIIVSMIALMFNLIRIIFLVSVVLAFIIGFMYPMSSYSNKVDESDPSLKNMPRQKKKKSNPAPVNAAPAQAANLPATDAITEAQVPQNAEVDIIQEQYMREEQQQLQNNANLYAENPYIDNPYNENGEY